MTRLIDADALKAEWYRINDIDETDRGVRFVGYTEIARLIDNAPTVQADGDLISRQDAILAITGEPPEAHYPSWYADRIKSLPSAETHDKRTETHGVCSDLISRGDAIEAVRKVWFDNDNLKDFKQRYYEMGNNDAVEDAIGYIDALPSAGDESRLYIKIYADDEPSVKAEKLYQICGETQNREVAEWLKEHFPSAPDSRQRGEWVWDEDAMDWGIGAWVCNKCGCRPNTLWSTKRDSIPLAYAGSRFCGYCGAYMGGQNDD